MACPRAWRFWRGHWGRLTEPRICQEQHESISLRQCTAVLTWTASPWRDYWVNGRGSRPRVLLASGECFRGLIPARCSGWSAVAGRNGRKHLRGGNFERGIPRCRKRHGKEERVVPGETRRAGGTEGMPSGKGAVRGKQNSVGIPWVSNSKSAVTCSRMCT
jgi:hypothetical protein